jgi:hypothetical protein
VVWHEIEVNWAKADPTVLPVQITEHVAEVRALLAARGMSDVKILIDEYGAPETYALPGWTVGYLAALEAANVDGAMRSCWDAASASGGIYSQCDRGLNGLYAENNTTPLPNYWIHAAYAAMTGKRVAATPSTARLSAFAARDTSGVTRALIGRHESCTLVVTRDCPGGTGSSPAAIPVTVTVVVASTVKTARVTVTRIGVSDSTGPAPVSDAVLRVVRGQLSVTLPQVWDTDAYSVTVTPTS